MNFWNAKPISYLERFKTKGFQIEGQNNSEHASILPGNAITNRDKHYYGAAEGRIKDANKKFEFYL